MFFKKASDAEARAWLAKKQVIAWGIINELAIEIERLQGQGMKDGQQIEQLRQTIETLKAEHKKKMTMTIDKNTNEYDNLKQTTTQDKQEVVARYETQIEQMTQEHLAQVDELKSEIAKVRQQL